MADEQVVSGAGPISHPQVTEQPPYALDPRVRRTLSLGTAFLLGAGVTAGLISWGYALRDPAEKPADKAAHVSPDAPDSSQDYTSPGPDLWKQYRAMYEAAKNLDVAQIEKYQAQGISVDVSFDPHRDRTALKSVIYDKNIEAVRILLNHGAQVDHTVMIEALRTKRLDIAGILMPYYRDKENAEPLMSTMLYPNLEGASLLLLNGVNPNAQDKDGNTALMKAVRYNYMDGFVFLINRQVDVRHTNKAGVNAYMMAAELGNVDMMKVLEQAHVNVHLADNNGKTAFVYALDEGYVKAAQHLIDQGSDISIRNKHIKDAFRKAVYDANIDMVNLFLTKPVAPVYIAEALKENTGRSGDSFYTTSCPSSIDDRRADEWETHLAKVLETLRDYQKKNISAEPYVELTEVGTKLPDGRIYAGTSPDTHGPMFLSPADYLTDYYVGGSAQKEQAMMDRIAPDSHFPSPAEMKVIFNNRKLGALSGIFNGKACEYFTSENETGECHNYPHTMSFADGRMSSFMPNDVNNGRVRTIFVWTPKP